MSVRPSLCLSLSRKRMLNVGETRDAASLHFRQSTRTDILVIFSPSLICQVLYIPEVYFTITASITSKAVHSEHRLQEKKLLGYNDIMDIMSVRPVIASNIIDILHKLYTQQNSRSWLVGAQLMLVPLMDLSGPS